MLAQFSESYDDDDDDHEEVPVLNVISLLLSVNSVDLANTKAFVVILTSISYLIIHAFPKMYPTCTFSYQTRMTPFFSYNGLKVYLVNSQ